MTMTQVIYIEYRPEKKGDPVRMTVQGKEFATWVKVKGHGCTKSAMWVAVNHRKDGRNKTESLPAGRSNRSSVRVR